MSRAEAASLCAARGGELASYESEDARSMVDILCDSSLSMECWISTEASTLTRCMSVRDGQASKTACSVKLHPVCQRAVIPAQFA